MSRQPSNKALHENKVTLRCGFTLAEVLVTLAIIGVMAALTIPAFLQQIYEEQTIAKVKKAYSTLSQAFLHAQTENPQVETWDGGFTDIEAEKSLWNILGRSYNVTKLCPATTGCFPDLTYKQLDGTDDENLDSRTDKLKGILADGSLFYIVINPTDIGCTRVVGTSMQLQNRCAGFFIDVNGNKPPNTRGRDSFYFHITKYGIVPSGTMYDTAQPPSTCNKDNGYGNACTAYVLSNGNMDYLE